MTPTHTSRNGKRYRYYVCRHTWKHESGKSQTVAAADIERVVIDQIIQRRRTQRMTVAERRLDQRIKRVDYDGDPRRVIISFHSEARHCVAQKGGASHEPRRSGQ